MKNKIIARNEIVKEVAFRVFDAFKSFKNEPEKNKPNLNEILLGTQHALCCLVSAEIMK